MCCYFCAWCWFDWLAWGWSVRHSTAGSSEFLMYVTWRGGLELSVRFTRDWIMESAGRWGKCRVSSESSAHRISVRLKLWLWSEIGFCDAWGGKWIWKRFTYKEVWLCFCWDWFLFYTFITCCDWVLESDWSGAGSSDTRGVWCQKMDRPQHQALPKCRFARPRRYGRNILVS